MSDDESDILRCLYENATQSQLETTLAPQRLKTKIESQLELLLLRQEVLERKVDKFMASVSQDLKDLSAQFDTATTAVGQRLDRLMQGLKNSMTDQELADAKAGFRAEIDRLTVMGKDPTNPVPTP